MRWMGVSNSRATGERKVPQAPFLIEAMGFWGQIFFLGLGCVRRRVPGFAQLSSFHPMQS